MKKTFILTFVLFLALFGGCQQQGTLTEGQKVAIKKEVNDQFTQMVSAACQLDASMWSENFSKDEFVSVILGTDYFDTRSDFIELMTTYFSMRDQQHIDSLQVQITVLSQNLVLVTSVLDIEMLLKDGTGFKFKDAFTSLWKKEQNSWKIVHAHESWVEK